MLATSAALVSYLAMSGIQCCMRAAPVVDRSGQPLAYSADDMNPVADSCHHLLQSATGRRCIVPHTHNTFGDHSFNVSVTVYSHELLTGHASSQVHTTHLATGGSEWPVHVSEYIIHVLKTEH